MALDIMAALSKSSNATKFSTAFVQAYLAPAFGARSKSEIDLLVFSCLIEAQAIDPNASEYDIARALNITPTRARNLMLNWQLRSTPAAADLRSAIIDALKNTRFSNDGKLLTFGVESPLLKEEIIARLKRKGVFPDASFAKELVKLPVDAFVEFLDDVVDNDTKRQVRATLVKDRQLPDISFKALATGVLGKLGEKVVGEASGAVAKDLVGKVAEPAIARATAFLTSVLIGDVKAASKASTLDDFLPPPG
jgi:hypothetical protein